jgi:hypothetical protein
MGAIIGVLATIGFLVALCYLKFPPPYADKNLVHKFDMMVLSVCGFLCFMWTLSVALDWRGTSESSWWIPLSIIGSLGIESVFLGLLFVVRNYWVFKPPRRPGGL